MLRFLGALLLAAAAPLSVAGQDFERPDDWTVRFDDPQATEADLEMFVAMPPGWHVTTGPSAIFWSPDNTASGDFRAEMEVFLFDPQGRREAFGIFVGGEDLEGPDQEYTYFLIRDGGEYIIKRRVGDRAPTVRPWTEHEAIHGYTDRGDDVSVLNVLTVEARGDTVRFLVNNAEVAALPRSEVPVNGVYGFRINHGLNVHVRSIEAVPLS